MTHHHDPPGRETVSFGRGGAGSAGEPPPDDEQDAVGRPGEVDAWYTEDEPAPIVPSQPSWLSARWASWRAVDRDRRIIVVLAVVTVIALLAAIVGLAARDDSTAIELPAVERHGLNPDEAVCFAFGLIQNRLEVRLEPDGLDSSAISFDGVTGPINQEIQAIDNLAAEHPEADYRLITAFAAVADAGTTLTETDALTRLRSAVADRAAAVAAAIDACESVAGFDVAGLEPN